MFEKYYLKITLIRVNLENKVFKNILIKKLLILRELTAFCRGREFSILKSFD